MKDLSFVIASFDELLYISQQDSKANKTAWSYQDYVDSFNNSHHHIMLLKKTNTIIGVISYSIIGDEAEILQLFIIAEYQSQGYASSLMQMFLDEVCANNIQQILLEVREDNLVAKNLYDKFGFIEAYTRKNYYKCGNSFIDAQIMLKTI